MDDFKGKGQARELHGWVLSPEERGSLKLVLQYGPASDQAGEDEGLVQLLLPPEAALHLANELNRQARRTLDQQARGLPRHPTHAAAGRLQNAVASIAHPARPRKSSRRRSLPRALLACCLSRVALREVISALPLECCKFSAPQSGDFSGGQRLLTFRQRIEPEIGIGQHLEQMARDGPEADFRLLEVVGNPASGGESRVPFHALEFDRRNIDFFPGI